MERSGDDESQFEAAARDERPAEESRNRPRLERLGSDGEALALHEI